ncbi:MAG: hypothetical protein IIX14_08795 [Clostridia bacterium]|nr:hypothetical protein [Clostridia bacterium]
MDETIIAAIIAASIAAITGITNICLTIHRNKQDGITSYRMQWINNVREEFSNILSWTWYTQDSQGKITPNPIDELRKSVYKVCLYLNVKDDYDYKILEKTFEYLNMVTKTYEPILLSQSITQDELNYLAALQSSAAFTESKKIKEELQKLVRVYLKTEWTRVKVESSVLKTQYSYCWKLFKGFQSQKAVEKFLSEYKE